MEILEKQAKSRYSSSLIIDYLVDRTALGFDFEFIRQEFELIFTSSINRNEYEELLIGKEEVVKERRREIYRSLISQNIYSTLLNLKSEIEDAKTRAMESEDFRSYVGLINTLLKVLELLMKSIESFKKTELDRIRSSSANNLSAIRFLEAEGIITIKDHEKLKRLVLPINNCQ